MDKRTKWKSFFDPDKREVFLSVWTVTISTLPTSPRNALTIHSEGDADSPVPQIPD